MESQVAEGLGNQAYNQKVYGLIPGLCENDVVSLGKELHPTFLEGMSLYFKSLWIRASAK